MSERKCLDCKHYAIDGRGPRFVAACINASRLLFPCRLERGPDGACGPEGKNFQPYLDPDILREDRYERERMSDD